MLVTSLAVSIVAASAAGLATRSAAPAPDARARLAGSSDGAAVLGRARAGPISFLVSLRSSRRPVCLINWGRAAHLDVTWPPGQRWASISGAAPAVDAAFGVEIVEYRLADGKTGFASDHRASVPLGVCGEVAGVGTIHSFTPPTTYDVPQGGLTNLELMRAYDATALSNAGYHGQGETVVVVEVSGFNQSDLDTFGAREHLPRTVVSVLGKNTGGTGETPMDIETVHEIAPDARLVVLNLTSVAGASSDADVFALGMSRAAALYPGAIFSISLGLCETDTQIFNRADLVALNNAIASIESRGSTVFASSGDSGGLDCTPPNDDGDPPQAPFEGVSEPAALPSVTGTGGTALTTDAAGNYIGETTWSEPLLSQGSGGGVSRVFARPSWQTGVGTGGQVDSGNGREVPDVGSDADPATGNFIIEGGSPSQGGGTSLAAPTWAGFTALWDQLLRAAHDPPVGFFNPILYHLADSRQPAAPFHDVTLGGNDFYLATPGYDMVTGLGSPDVANLGRDLLAGRY